MGYLVGGETVRIHTARQSYLASVDSVHSVDDIIAAIEEITARD